MKEYQLPRAFAEKWITALRSGEYKQGEGFLYKYDCFCCIGVAGSVAGIPLIKMERKGVFEFKTNDLKSSDLPKQLIGCDFPYSSTYNQLVQKLTVLNDIQKKTFLEIANWIEENVEFTDQ